MNTRLLMGVASALKRSPCATAEDRRRCRDFCRVYLDGHEPSPADLRLLLEGLFWHAETKAFATDGPEGQRWSELAQALDEASGLVPHGAEA